MTALGRAFVAIVPPVEALDEIDRAVASLRRATLDVRWTPRDQWHLTLQFLGAVPDAESFERALRSALDGAAPPTVAFGGLGAFGSARRATVLWVGVREGSQALVDLAERAGLGAVGVGLRVEDRRYRPHLTIARASSPVDLRDVIAAVPPVVGMPWCADEVVLFESTLGRGPARHAPRARVRLGANG